MLTTKIIVNVIKHKSCAAEEALFLYEEDEGDDIESNRSMVFLFVPLTIPPGQPSKPTVDRFVVANPKHDFLQSFFFFLEGPNYSTY